MSGLPFMRANTLERIAVIKAEMLKAGATEKFIASIQGDYKPLTPGKLCTFFFAKYDAAELKGIGISNKSANTLTIGVLSETLALLNAYIEVCGSGTDKEAVLYEKIVRGLQDERVDSLEGIIQDMLYDRPDADEIRERLKALEHVSSGWTTGGTNSGVTRQKKAKDKEPALRTAWGRLKEDQKGRGATGRLMLMTGYKKTRCHNFAVAMREEEVKYSAK